MRCTGCGYSLWNQPAPADGSPRKCPECGLDYALDQFSFAHGKVEFCCPGCSQPYFGTDDRGHLDPKEFECVRCGVPLSMDRCTARPHGDLPEAQAMQVEPLPWLGGSGWVFGRWFRTIGACISDPTRIPARIEGLHEFGPAARFLSLQLAVIYGIALIFGLLTTIVMFSIAGSLGGGGAFQGLTPGAVAPGIGMVVATSVLSMLLSAFFFLAGIIGTAGIVSLVSGHDRIGFGRMLSVLSFSSSIMIFSLVPVCGGLIAPILWIVQSAQAVAAAVPNDRKAVAVVAAVVTLVFSWLLQCGAGAVSGFFF